MSALSDSHIPLLTDIVEPETERRDADRPERTEAGDEGEARRDTVIPDIEAVIAELQTRLASRTYELTDDLLRSAFADMEANIFRQLSSNLRQQLPELIDTVLREHLEQEEEED